VVEEFVIRSRSRAWYGDNGLGSAAHLAHQDSTHDGLECGLV
jgi:hypothetical protein